MNLCITHTLQVWEHLIWKMIANLTKCLLQMFTAITPQNRQFTSFNTKMYNLAPLRKWEPSEKSRNFAIIRNSILIFQLKLLVSVHGKLSEVHNRRLVPFHTIEESSHRVCSSAPPRNCWILLKNHLGTLLSAGTLPSVTGVCVIGQPFPGSQRLVSSHYKDTEKVDRLGQSLLGT